MEPISTQFGITRTRTFTQLFSISRNYVSNSLERGTSKWSSICTGTLKSFFYVVFTPIKKKSYNSFSYSFETDFVESRIFPVLVDSLSPVFDITQCSFNLSKQRSGTARQVLINEIRCPLTYTIETSYCGYNKNQENAK